MAGVRVGGREAGQEAEGESRGLHLDGDCSSSSDVVGVFVSSCLLILSEQDQILRRGNVENSKGCKKGRKSTSRDLANTVAEAEENVDTLKKDRSECCF